jgi:hypothetical protein
MDLPLLLLDALLSLFPADLGAAERARLGSFVAPVDAAASAAPLWEGEAWTLATGLSLVAIGQHETRFGEGPRRCRPRGPYVGTYQILPGPNLAPHAAREVCESDDLQARLALRLLHRARAQCKTRCTADFLFRAYASGSGGVDSPEARQIASLWQRLARREGLEVNPHAVAPPRLTGAPSP